MYHEIAAIPDFDQLKRLKQLQPYVIQSLLLGPWLDRGCGDELFLGNLASRKLSGDSPFSHDQNAVGDAQNFRYFC